MNPADDRLEKIIAAITSALADTGDRRFALLQAQAVCLRSHEQVDYLERERTRLTLGLDLSA